MELDRRSNAIMGAYQTAEGNEYAKKVRLATGLTFPEAVNSGMLPYEIILAHRPEDPVTVGDCRRAMFQEGASSLIDPVRPPLLFGTEAEAQAARDRLIQKLPGSEPVWLIHRQVGYSQDPAYDEFGLP